MTLAEGNLVTKIDEGGNKASGEVHTTFRVLKCSYANMVDPGTGHPVVFALLEVVS
jgi:hypothetical protein